jgi:hypothetical protein
MQEIDKSSGMVAPEVKRQAEANFKNKNQVQPLRAPENGALDDKAIAGNMLQQAKQMELDAKSMIAEAARMKKDAERMFPSATTSDAKKSEATKSAPKARTRKKAVTADAIQ